MFSEKISVLDHRLFERLKNHAALLQVFGNDIAFDQLIAGKDHTPGEVVQAARIPQNVSAIVVRKCRAELEWREIEKIDTGKTPGLIFTRRGWKRLKLFPGFTLLLAKPI